MLGVGSRYLRVIGGVLGGGIRIGVGTVWGIGAGAAIVGSIRISVVAQKVSVSLLIFLSCFSYV